MKSDDEEIEKLKESAAYQSPQKECDVIMKGGITSGVVYPLASCELARSYRFRNVGGASAGAIAATLAAAAEYGRDVPNAESFAGLAQLPDYLKTNLLSLFQPSREMKPLFAILLAVLRRKGNGMKLVGGLWAAIRSCPLTAILGAGVGVLLFWLSVVLPAGSFASWFWAAPLLLFALLAMLAALVVRLWRLIQSGLPANMYGLCTGFADEKGRKQEPLTNWLTDLIHRTAGVESRRKPLTFGDLWGNEEAANEEETSERKINLELMTTNLTHSRPYRLPFETRIFFFDPAEFGELFPPEIVTWMKERSRKDRARVSLEGKTVLPLPKPEDFPVVVAARMSLSFPLLISAVPLYAIDYTRTVAYGEKRRPERCWFSDGGIGSNFPVHFFDAFIPKRPTFGINLRTFGPDASPSEDESKNVWFPQRAGQGTAPRWNRFSGTFGFVWSIIDTMQNWVDSTQMVLPGYRDRVVHIYHDDKEGGMNLDMDSAVIKSLSRRGWHAGQKLADFDWVTHRWTRYRTAMSQLEKALRATSNGYNEIPANDRDFRGHFEFYSNETASYKWTKKTQQPAKDETDRLLDIAAGWKDGLFSHGAPRPVPELKIRPRV